MRCLTFVTRNRKEILRDPLTLAFGIGFPLVILLLLSAIQANIPVDLFMIDRLVPGIAVFGLSFITLFSSMLIAKDRTSSFLLRLFSSPMKASDYILGYTLPMIPISIAQSLICFAAALCLGLTFNINLLICLLVLLPADLFFIGFGLMAGTILNDKQVGGICGALLTNVSAWLSGTWFDLSLVGGWFKKIAYALPFAHAVDASRAALSGKYSDIMPHLWWVIGYAAAMLIIAVVIFNRKMKADQG